MLLTSDLQDSFFSYESVGDGFLFVLADLNMIDNVYKSTNDNSVLLGNLVLTQPQIPEPPAFAIWSLIGLSFMAVGWCRRRKVA